MDKPTVLAAHDVAPRTKPSNYPEPFAGRVAGRVKRTLGDPFGLKNFGVNLTILSPGTQSALLHRHERQDEFVYILEGEPVLITDAGETQMRPGDCAGFPAGGAAHQLVNRTAGPVVYLEVGDRTQGDVVEYPVDDLEARMGENGQWRFFHKDGTPW